MDQPAVYRVKGISTGLFLAVFLIPFVLTYIVGWLSTFMGMGVGSMGAAWLLTKAFLVVLYVCMIAASLLRGVANGSKWAVVFPIAAGIFDIVPPLSLVPLVPTVLNIIALIMGVRAGKTASHRMSN